MATTTRNGRMVKDKRQVASIAPGLVLAVLAVVPQAQAADECGADGPGADTVVCAGGAYPGGITYEGSDGLTLVLDDPTITSSAGSDASAVLVESDTTTPNSVVIIARQLDTITRNGDDAIGILARNQGLGGAAVEFESGIVRATDPTEFGNAGIGATIVNTNNTEDAIVTVRGGLIQSAGELSAGTIAVNAGSGDARTVVTGGTIQTTGEISPGVYGVAFQTDSTASVDIRVSGGNISTTGDGDSFVGTLPHAVYGLTGTKGDVTILIEGGVISTTGRRAYGVNSELSFLLGDNSGGTHTMSATMTGGTITTAGEQSHGLVARNFLSISDADARARMDNGTITISGDDTIAINADNWGRGLAEAIMTGGQITNSGIDGKGVMAQVRDRASGQVARVQLSGGTISTTGAGGHAVQARSEIDAGVEIAMTGGDVSTSGDGAYGVFADRAVNFGDETVELSLTGGSITTSGADAHGVYASNESSGLTRVLTAIDITATGDRADGIRVDAREGVFDLDIVSGTVTGGFPVVGDLSPATIQTIGDAGGTIDIHVDAVIKTPLGFNSIQDGAGDTQINVAGTLTQGLKAGAGNDSVFFAASSRISTTSRSKVLMGEGSDTVTIESGADLRNVFTLDGGSRSVGPDPDVDNLIIRGNIYPLSPSFFTGWETVTIDGGTFGTSTGSGFGIAVGTAEGQGVILRNGAVFFAGGSEALNGNIDIQEGTRYVGAGSNASGLDGTYLVYGSMRNMGLVTTRGGTNSDGVYVRGDYAGGGALDLDVDFATGRSDTLIVAGDVTAPGTTINVTGYSSGPASGADITLVNVTGTTNDGDFVLSGGAVNAGAYSYVLNRTGTSWQLTPGFNAAAGAYQSAGYVLGAFMSGFDAAPQVQQSARTFGTQSAFARGAWVQAAGSRFDVTSAGTASGAITGTSQRLQFGYETLAESSGVGQWVFGITGQIGSYSATTQTAAGTTKISADGIGLGATAAWFGPNGVYVNTKAEINRLSVDYTTNGTALAAEETVLAFGASVELGQRIVLSPTSAIVPQVQISWSHIEGQQFTDSTNTRVDVAQHNRVVGRAGVAYERNLQRAGFVYAKASVLHDFNADSSATVGGTSLAGTFDDTWVEVGFGGAKTWDQNTSVYADMTYKRGLDSSSSAVSLNAGFKLVW